MAVADPVRALIERLSPEPVCDDCIVDTLKLSLPGHANRKTRELAGRDGFERTLGACSLCGGARKVIRQVRTRPVGRTHLRRGERE